VYNGVLCWVALLTVLFFSAAEQQMRGITTMTPDARFQRVRQWAEKIARSKALAEWGMQLQARPVTVRVSICCCC
jgi:hypothetical protein